ncbi:MAG TPA: DUF418 domain-containing protein [Steroidobacteraceae bacterium]|nr:DUF418 domain-containing protein [Steroidobacteraceae bacterium]
MDEKIPKPIEGHQRIAIVDILRGWALLSVVLVNYVIFFSFQRNMRVPADDVLSRILKGIVQVLFQGKGWPLLAFLFGYGFSVLIANIKTKGLNPLPFFSRRMFWLLVFGIFNCALYYGDVLKDYALIGLIILMFHRISSRQALALSALCFVSFPALIVWSRGLHYHNPIASPELTLYTNHNPIDVLWFGLKSGLNISLSISKYFDWNLVMLACSFAGVFAHKVDMFAKMQEYKKYISRIFWLSLIFAIVSAALRNFGSRWNIDDYYDIEMWFFLGQMVFFAAGICWLYLNGKMMAPFRALQLVGRMTLTNYMVQNLIGLFIFSGVGLGLLHKIPYSYHVAFAVLVFVAQIYFSKWWLSRYKYGPVEWLWRMLSYKQALSIKKVYPHSDD